jgi:hypothetical protein
LPENQTSPSFKDTVSAEIVNAADGILTVKITGRLTQPELAAAQKAAAEVLQQQGKGRVLVITENFQGWERGGDWGDQSFQLEHDAHIEKMAIVGDKKWEDLALVFASKGLRSFAIEYFPPAHLAQARAWLAETPK